MFECGRLDVQVGTVIEVELSVDFNEKWACVAPRAVGVVCAGCCRCRLGLSENVAAWVVSCEEWKERIQSKRE